MSDFTDFYKKLLILQYYDKPKASAEIDLYSSEFEANKTALDEFINQIDIDKASGAMLDLIGKIVGLSRIVEQSVVKKYFAFVGTPNGLGFGEGVYYDAINDELLTDSELNDTQYRRFLRLKISQNTASTTLYDDERVNLQEAILQAFDGKAYIRDNQDMTLSIVIDNDIDTDDLQLVISAGIIPKPQGVRLRYILADPVQPFGFLGAPNCVGYDSGIYASIL